MSSAEMSCGEPVADKRLAAALQRECLQLAHMSSSETSFPGSQPVSFERKHLDKALGGRAYFAAEKTDGVRYMLLAAKEGTFLVDRKFNFRRVRLHLPRRDIPAAQVCGSLLDGELVEDVDPASGARVLRYLVYDAVAVHGKLLLGEPLPLRLLYAHKYVLAPRGMQAGHDFSAEPFSLELKAFYAAGQLRHVFETVIPQLHHENDGVIFTPAAEPYVVGTCHSLLKWKPAHMNTVDFRLLPLYRQRQARYQLGAASGAVTVPYAWLDPAEADLPQLAQLGGQIVECWYDPHWTTTSYAQGKDWAEHSVARGGWRYMRPRADKHIPNDESVVTKVIRSIQDNVTQQELLAAVEPPGGGGGGQPQGGAGAPGADEARGAPGGGGGAGERPAASRAPAAADEGPRPARAEANGAAAGAPAGDS